MSGILRLPNLALGDVECDVLEALWAEGRLNPVEAHARVGARRGISINTVSSALKRLHDKGLVRREKVSHAYVYAPCVTRGELQRFLIDAVAEQFGSSGGQSLMAAFVDVAQERGEDTLRELEHLVAERLGEDRR